MGNRKRVVIMSTIVFMFVIGVVLYSSVLLLRRRVAPPIDNVTIRVAASFYPLAEFARQVGGDMVTVTTITSAGAEPHDYEPTPQDIAAVYSANVFIFNGNGVDAWADTIASDVQSHGVTIIRAADYVDLLQSSFEGTQRSSNDPHFWLNPINAAKEVKVIAAALVRIDPQHEKEYTANRDAYVQQLVELDAAYAAGLANCSLREIVTAHNAFDYLAAQYGLRTLYILGLSPDEEPSPQTIARVVDAARRKNIKYIFFESLVNPKISQTIADEIGARVLILNPIEGLTPQEIAAGKNYISEMKRNLANLRIALVCQ